MTFKQINHQVCPRSRTCGFRFVFLSRQACANSRKYELERWYFKFMSAMSLRVCYRVCTDERAAMAPCDIVRQRPGPRGSIRSSVRPSAAASTGATVCGRLQLSTGHSTRGRAADASALSHRGCFASCPGVVPEANRISEWSARACCTWNHKLTERGTRQRT